MGNGKTKQNKSNNNGKKINLDQKQQKYDKMKEQIFKKKENDENENDDDDELKEESMVGAIAENEIYKEREGEVLNKEQVEKNDNLQVAKEQIVNKKINEFEAKNKSKIDLQKEGQQQQTTKDGIWSKRSEQRILITMHCLKNQRND